MLAQAKAARPARGPKLFFTSAKTGAGVSEVFAYDARRVVMRWEWEKEAVYVDVPDFDGDNSTFHLGDAATRSFRIACCSS
jgi:Ras-related protein Rab-7A